MTANQTIDGVPRELRDLLERVATEANHMLGFTYASNYDECRNAVDELRALLDEDICTSCDGSGEYIDAIGDWRGYCVCHAGVALENKPAAHPKGDAVAWQIRSRTNRPESVWTEWRECSEMELAMHSHEVGKFNPFGIMREIRPLYAEQPAPVAVVLPERMSLEKPEHHTAPVEIHNGVVTGWNACLDEVTRLNTKE